jgi:hypothetical protein
VLSNPAPLPFLQSLRNVLVNIHPRDHRASDAHESSILAEVLGLASIFLRRNRLALLEPYSINSPSPATHFPLCHSFLRPSTPLATPREAAALPDDPRLASCSTRRLVCITAPSYYPPNLSATLARNGSGAQPSPPMRGIAAAPSCSLCSQCPQVSINHC